MKTTHYSASSAKSFLTYEDAHNWLLQSSIISPQTNFTSNGTRQQLRRYPSLTASRPSCLDTPKRKYAEAGVQCDKSSPNSNSRVSIPLLDPSASKPLTLSTIPSDLSPPAVVPPPPSEVQLSAEQLKILEMTKSGRNVFFTGPAGTGKSVLLREIIRQLRSINNGKQIVAVTAPTGIAGLNIGGSTIYSWAGIGFGKEPADKLANKIRYSRRLAEKWKETNILVIDEISMLDGTLFDKLEYIARVVRNSQKPFGGIQLVLCGDFFQLPPVPEQSHQYRMPATFTFHAETWRRCISRPIFLTQVFRQRDDVFISILSSLRHGKLTSDHIARLQQLRRPLHYDDGIKPIHLFSLRVEAESCNNEHLNALETQEQTYYSVDSAGYDVNHKRISETSAKGLLDRLIAPSVITLKLGAQVMLIINIEQGALVNGSTGTVLEFLTHHEALKRNIKIATLNRLPESSQTTQKERALENPMPMPSDLLKPFNNNCFTSKQAWPLVRFTNGLELLCAPMAFSVQGFMGNIEAHRLQVPLILAWALSIHKSQGQTLPRVKVDLGHVFEKGQAYVALSRATCMEGLQIENFQPSKVLAHPEVIKWHSYWKSRYQSNDAEFEDEMDSEEAMSQYYD